MKRLNSSLAFAIAMLLFCLVLKPQPANADITLFGTTNRGGQISDLVRLDPHSGALIENIGSIGYSVNGLTWDRRTKTLYGTTSVRDPNFVGLITIDTKTGVGTPVGVGWGPNFSINSIETDSHGQIYGWWGPGQHALVTLDKTTGDFNLIGNSGLDTVRIGLAFDNDGTLYLNNGMNFQNFTIDVMDGSSTFASQFQSIAHHGDINPYDNLYYGIDTPGNGPKNIVIGDLSAGGFFLDIWPTVDSLHTLTFAIPEPSTMALVLLIGMIGVTRHRRR